MVYKEELQLHRNLKIDTKNRFDMKKYYAEWLREYFKIFGKPAPESVKKMIKGTKVMWINDEHLLFRILADDFLKEDYECPKCNSKKGFIPTRYKKLNQVIEKNKPVVAERPRTLSCSECSFTFNPMAITYYRGIRMDLRKIWFYKFISEDGKIKYPISSIQKIMDISYGTAKKIKKHTEEGTRLSGETTDEFAEKFIGRIHENHYWTKLISQKADKERAKEQKQIITIK